MARGSEGKRWAPHETAYRYARSFLPEDPEFLDYDAADFVIAAMNKTIAASGAQSARLDRAVVVEAAAKAGHDRLATQAAITFIIRLEILIEEGATLRTTQIAGPLDLPGRQHRLYRHGTPRTGPFPRPYRTKALALVREIVARRGDARPVQTDPLDAFPDTLTALGLARFRMWWTQTVAELRACDPNTMPTAAVVLAAALVEGALAFAVKPARERGVGPMMSRDFERPLRTWTITDLVTSAGAGGEAAILGSGLKAQADHLVQMRHRIHAGRLMAEHPGQLPDLRPEEARAGKATAEHVARAVMDWLARYPTS